MAFIYSKREQIQKKELPSWSIAVETLYTGKKVLL